MSLLEQKIKVLEKLVYEGGVAIVANINSWQKRQKLCHNVACADCIARKECDRVAGGSYLKFNIKEIKEIEETHPEFFT